MSNIHSTQAPAGELLAPTAADLRHALGQFATGVCVIACPGVTDHPTPFAITVNSFASVSLDPALVLWSIQKDSSSYRLWCDAQQFGISVLNASQASLCHRYAEPGQHTLTDSDDHADSPLGNPVMPDAVAVFDCTISARHDAGDHTIIVSKVEALQVNDNRDPLIYLRGRVHAST
ncbi:MAG: flavin reductase family protein [Pseudomonadota bacterium]